jgi:hypothetical protein
MRVVKKISERIGHFIASIIFVVLLPLVPLGIELWYSNKLSAQSLTISAAIYSITVGIYSGRAVFAISVLISVLFSAAFGVVLAAPASALANCELASCVAIGGIAVTHSVVRLGRHCKQGQPFGGDMI